MTSLPGGELSEREQEILRLVATGASNKEIAAQLSISTNTVKVHLRNIFAKIGANSRTEAAMYAVSAGLAPGGPQDAHPVPAASSTDVPAALAPDVLAAVASAAQPIEALLSPEGQPSLARRNVRLWISLAAVLLIILAAAFANLIRATWLTNNSSSPTEIVRWKILPPLPSARSFLAAVGYEGSIYVLGGKLADGATGTVERYDLAQNTWEQMAAKPTPVYEHTGVVLGGRIFIPGGRLDSGEVTNVLEIYDPLTDTWASGAPLPRGVSAYAAVAYEGRLYLFGGWDGSKFLDSVYVYDPALNQWSELPAMPEARGYLGAAVAENRIYLIGGFDGQKALATNRVFQPDRLTQPVGPWSSAKPLPEPTYAMGVTGLADNIYVLGGNGQTEKKYSALAYIEPLDEWQEFDAPPSPVGSGLGFTSQGVNLYALGGLVNKLPSVENLTCQALYTLSFPIIVK